MNLVPEASDLYRATCPVCRSTLWLSQQDMTFFQVIGQLVQGSVQIKHEPCSCWMEIVEISNTERLSILATEKHPAVSGAFSGGEQRYEQQPVFRRIKTA